SRLCRPGIRTARLPGVSRQSAPLSALARWSEHRRVQPVSRNCSSHSHVRTSMNKHGTEYRFGEGFRASSGKLDRGLRRTYRIVADFPTLHSDEGHKEK